jgi:hypothetical protein
MSKVIGCDMITRAYQNAKGERQEVTLSQEEWDALLLPQLGVILGFEDLPVPDKKPQVRNLMGRKGK